MKKPAHFIAMAEAAGLRVDRSETTRSYHLKLYVTAPNGATTVITA